MVAPYARPLGRAIYFPPPHPIAQPVIALGYHVPLSKYGSRITAIRRCCLPDGDEFRVLPGALAREISQPHGPGLMNYDAVRSLFDALPLARRHSSPNSRW